MVTELFASRTSDAIDIDAPADLVWSVYSDVVGWPAWTASVTSVELSPGMLSVISKPVLRVAMISELRRMRGSQAIS